jgi:hypothetical protein
VNDLSGLRLISEKAQVIDVGSKAGEGGARGEIRGELACYNLLEAVLRRYRSSSASLLSAQLIGSHNSYNPGIRLHPALFRA